MPTRPNEKDRGWMLMTMMMVRCVRKRQQSRNNNNDSDYKYLPCVHSSLFSNVKYYTGSVSPVSSSVAMLGFNARNNYSV